MTQYPISVVILSKNSSPTIARTLTTLQNFSDVVLFDTGSIDDTLTIARAFPNVSIFQGELKGFGKARNEAASHARNDWIFALDSDEALSGELLSELDALTLNSDQVYSFPFKNLFNGKWIKGCGWHPDRHIRLYDRRYASFSRDFVHERLLFPGLTETPLKGSIEHLSYRSVSDFLVKMERYSQLFAEQNCGKKKSSLRKALLHGSFAFFKSYLLKRGFRDGAEGFVISLYNGQTAYYKYLKLAEYNRRCL